MTRRKRKAVENQMVREGWTRADWRSFCRAMGAQLERDFRALERMLVMHLIAK